MALYENQDALYPPSRAAAELGLEAAVVEDEATAGLLRGHIAAGVALVQQLTERSPIRREERIPLRMPIAMNPADVGRVLDIVGVVRLEYWTERYADGSTFPDVTEEDTGSWRTTVEGETGRALVYRPSGWPQEATFERQAFLTIRRCWDMSEVEANAVRAAIGPVVRGLYYGMDAGRQRQAAMDVLSPHRRGI